MRISLKDINLRKVLRVQVLVDEERWTLKPKSLGSVNVDTITLAWILYAVFVVETNHLLSLLLLLLLLLLPLLLPLLPLPLPLPHPRHPLLLSGLVRLVLVTIHWRTQDVNIVLQDHGSY
jgi:hypothetical protein